MDNYEVDEKQSIIPVKVKFDTNSDEVTVKVLATSQSAKTVAANKVLTLTNGRLFFVPIDVDSDSDLFSLIKVPSEMAGKIDVRYVKNGVACVLPIENYVKLNNEELICYLV